MLESENRKKIENYVDKLISDLKVDASKYYNAGLTNAQIVEKITSITVNKLTPVSKTILSSIYNMLLEQTMKKPQYSDVEQKKAFYELNIKENLNKEFTFEVPVQIDYEARRTGVNKWGIGGACAAVAVGGGMSFRFKSIIPIGIAVGVVAIAGIIMVLMTYVLQDKNAYIQSIIDEYYAEVKEALLSWIRSIEKYYDQCVITIERR